MDNLDKYRLSLYDQIIEWRVANIDEVIFKWQKRCFYENPRPTEEEKINCLLQLNKIITRACYPVDFPQLTIDDYNFY
jgi:hypothetical protein